MRSEARLILEKLMSPEDDMEVNQALSELIKLIKGMKITSKPVDNNDPIVHYNNGINSVLNALRGE